MLSNSDAYRQATAADATLHEGFSNLPVEQSRLASPAFPWHLRRCMLCHIQAPGDNPTWPTGWLREQPQLAHLPQDFLSLYQHADPMSSGAQGSESCLILPSGLSQSG